MKFAARLEDVSEDRANTEILGTNERFIDAWLVGHGKSTVITQEGNFSLHASQQGTWGQARLPVMPDDPMSLRQATRKIYNELFCWLGQHPALQLARIWNFVPQLNFPTPGTVPFVDMYQNFNLGRHEAFVDHFAEDDNGWILPAASAVGTQERALILEFYAIPSTVIFLENKDQIPAAKYSKDFGPRPPLFARGVLYKRHGQQIVISSGTAAIKGEKSLHPGDVRAQLMTAFDNLRILVSESNLRCHNVDFGFQLEQMRFLQVYYRHEADRALLEKETRLLVGPHCKRAFLKADICRSDLLVEVEAVFVQEAQ